jgi:hypothetical protein
MRSRVRRFVKPGAALLLAGVVLSTAACGPRLDDKVGGFAQPESAIHDPVADVYFVSSIHENPRAHDGNGFISRVSPKGEVLDLRWIAGGVNGVTLDAPKGMSISGERLFVADIDHVRVFDRKTGAPLAAITPPGAVALNGMATGPDGTVYVTDTAWSADSDDSTGADAVFKIAPDLSVQVLCRGPALAQPNGITVDATGVYLVSWSQPELSRLEPDCKRTVLARFEKSGLDGLVRTRHGDFLASSWHGRAIYRVNAAHEIGGFFEHRALPGIGYDATRDRLLIPFYELGEVGFRDGTR